MVNCTKHSVKRWVERILGVTTDKERDDYIRDNNEQIKQHINTTFEYAEFIYKGQIGDNTTRNYFIDKDIVFVTNVTNDAVITVYKVDFNFTHDLNLTVAKGLIAEIKKLVEDKDKVEFKQLVETERLEDEFEKLSVELELAKKQVAIIEAKKKSVFTSIKETKRDTELIELEIKKHTNHLINSKEYRDDLKEIG